MTLALCLVLWGNSHLCTDYHLSVASERHGLDPHLVRAVAWHETRWRWDQKSSRGAVGILQVLPGWLKDPMCMDSTGSRQERLLDCGVRLLKYGLQECNGSVILALGWYHSGKCKSDSYARMVNKTWRFFLNE